MAIKAFRSAYATYVLYIRQSSSIWPVAFRTGNCMHAVHTRFCLVPVSVGVCVDVVSIRRCRCLARAPSRFESHLQRDVRVHSGSERTCVAYVPAREAGARQLGQPTSCRGACSRGRPSRITQPVTYRAETRGGPVLRESPSSPGVLRSSSRGGPSGPGHGSPRGRAERARPSFLTPSRSSRAAAN